MAKVQSYLDTHLSRPHIIRVRIDPRGPIPHEKKYDPIRNLIKTGFTLTSGELLCAIGCKVACLPSSDDDECFKSAYYFTHLLDFESPYLRYKRDPDSDLQTARSQEIGIGMTCLIASKCYGISWDQLNALPGPEKRFDFRGSTDSLRCIFEAKGTKYINNQSKQIAYGIEQKEAHHRRGEQFDIELVISSFIGTGNQEPLVAIAEPAFDGYDIAFNNQSEIYFKYRHYARVMQFIGATSLSRQLYVESHDLLHSGFRQNETGQQHPPKNNFHYLHIGKDRFIGNWYYSSAPLRSSRYDRFNKIELPSPINKFQKYRKTCFSR